MMMPLKRIVQPGSLSAQLAWFARLRWVAGSAVILAAGVDWIWVGWLEHPLAIMGIGAGILGYNFLLFMGLWWIVSRGGGEGVDLWHGRLARVDVGSTGETPVPRDTPTDVPLHGKGRRQWLIRLAWVQIVLDLACLTLLVVWTGGLYSPLIGFYVFHMVFASLLLPRRMGYAGTVVAGSLLAMGLVLTEQWPGGRREVLMFGGLIVTLVLTVYLANTLTMSLRQQRRRLILQNRRIRAITEQLRRHQQAMVQHEKMVAMGHMVAGITHEVANPLASMDSLLQLAQRKPERMNEKTVQTLREQVARVHRIIQEMKQFARPANGQRQTVSLNEVVRQSLEVLRYDKRLGGVEVRQELSSVVGEVSLLPQALEQVLVNLIQNALDAMEVGDRRSEMGDRRAGTEVKGVLTVRTDRRDGWQVIEVTDTGQGIPPEHMERLFEPFFTTKPVGQGTGLGLSISYSLVQKLGGSISVRSRVGEGTTFTIRLPAAGAPAELAPAR